MKTVLFRKIVAAGIAMAVAVSAGFSKEKPKVVTKAPTLLDWQGRAVGSEIPDWVKAVGDNNKRKIIKELDLGDYQIWVFMARGKNLEFLETWTDKVELQSNVAQSISSEIGRATQATMEADQNLEETQINQTITDITTVLSNVRVNGLEKFGSYWVKNGFANVKKPKKPEDYDVQYTYYTVWGVPKASFKKQIENAVKGVPNNTADDELLMKLITRSIEKVILGEEGGEGVEGVESVEEPIYSFDLE